MMGPIPTLGQIRYVNFLDLKDHAWLAKVIKRLTNAEFQACSAFIHMTTKLSKGDFELAVNRMFMDKPELRDQYTHWKEMTELLLCANSKISEPVANEPNAARLTEALRFGPKK